MLATEAERGHYTHHGCAGSQLCCDRCGLLVGDRVAHDLWHIRVDETIRKAGINPTLPGTH